MSYRLVAYDNLNLRLGEVSDLLQNDLPIDQAFTVLRTLMFRTKSKRIAKLVKLSTNTGFDPETVVESCKATGRVFSFFGFKVNPDTTMTCHFADDWKSILEAADEDLCGAVVVTRVAWERISRHVGINSAYQAPAIKEFLISLFKNTIAAYVNESLFEARLTDLISGKSQTIFGFTSVHEANRAAARAWPEWKKLRFRCVSTDKGDRENSELRWWRDRRGVPSDVGLIIRTDLCNELRNYSLSLSDRSLTDLLKSAVQRFDSSSHTSTILEWKFVQWTGAGAHLLEEYLKNRLKPYAYHFMRIRPTYADVVDAYGKAMNPSFRPEIVMNLQTVMRRI